MAVKKPPQRPEHRVIEMLGPLTSASESSARLQRQLGIPEELMRRANHHGIWDVTELLPYLR